MEDNLEYIDNYFGGNLSPGEAKQFEQRIIEDRRFAEEVAFYLSAKQTSKEEMISEKKEWFRQLADQHADLPKPVAPVRRFWKYAAAAAIIVCLFFAWYLTSVKSASPHQMAEEYIRQKLTTLRVTMGAERDSFQNAIRLFNEGQLVSALEKFERIAQADTSNFDAKIYSGIVHLKVENYDKALAYFQDLEKYTSRYSNPATFYHALTLMKRDRPNDKQEARRLLEQVIKNDLEEKKTAQQWLKKW